MVDVHVLEGSKGKEGDYSYDSYPTAVSEDCQFRAWCNFLLMG